MTADTEGKLTEDINAPPVGTVRPVGLNAARLAGRQDEPGACPRELVTAAPRRPQSGPTQDQHRGASRV